jgi:hypothetical protein
MAKPEKPFGYFIAEAVKLYPMLKNKNFLSRYPKAAYVAGFFREMEYYSEYKEKGEEHPIVFFQENGLEDIAEYLDLLRKRKRKATNLYYEVLISMSKRR